MRWAWRVKRWRHLLSIRQKGQRLQRRRCPRCLPALEGRSIVARGGARRNLGEEAGLDRAKADAIRCPNWAASLGISTSGEGYPFGKCVDAEAITKDHGALLSHRCPMPNFEQIDRPALMRLIKSKNTKPELVVRKALHRRGIRYRLHARELPGTPDIVFPKYRTVLQVRGCFWHMHGCKLSSVPTSRQEYWIPKLHRNAMRDEETDRALVNMGWQVVVVWECETRSAMVLESTVERVVRLLHGL